MIILKNIPLPKIKGITLWPFILVKSKKSGKVLINHELIHIRQQAELLVIFFYILYIAEWIYHFFKKKDFWQAYHSISFEQEAYLNERNLNYLQQRKWFASFKLLKF